MATQKKNAIVSYIGIDGACAAAMALLRFPAATVTISSAQWITGTLEELATQARPPAEIHVCGLGVSGEWSEAVKFSKQLREKGSKIYWYCGRGYLDAKRWAEISTPVFSDSASNTEAVCRHLRLAQKQGTQFLMDLARHDPWIEGVSKKPPQVDSRWLELIAASRAEYFKFNDHDRYVATIRKRLAEIAGKKRHEDLVIHTFLGRMSILTVRAWRLNLGGVG